jgi:serine/threonine-protein kinase RsbW
MHALPSRSSVAVTVPATPAHLRHLRVLAATVAADLGFAVDAIESMRVAVDELCALAMADATEDAVLTTTIESLSGEIVMTGSCGPVTDDPEVDPIAAQLLAAGSSSHSLSRDGDDCRFELRVERPADGSTEVDGR